MDTVTVVTRALRKVSVYCESEFQGRISSVSLDGIVIYYHLGELICITR
ncbi:MAG: hypothetical protein ACI8XM_000079 [Haloarculaceae archaeon]|jgi:hypothetical protein